MRVAFDADEIFSSEALVDMGRGATLHQVVFQPFVVGSH